MDLQQFIGYIIEAASKDIEKNNRIPGSLYLRLKLRRLKRSLKKDETELFLVSND
jgi:hypothetical protein